MCGVGAGRANGIRPPHHKRAAPDLPRARRHGDTSPERTPPEAHFLMVRNDVCRDDRLTCRSLGLLVAMLSYPDNWQFATERLAKGEGREGENAVRAALKELERSGYLVRHRTKAANGRFTWEQSPGPHQGPHPARPVGRPRLRHVSTCGPRAAATSPHRRWRTGDGRIGSGSPGPANRAPGPDPRGRSP